MRRADEVAPKAKWLCNRCLHTNGKPYENLGFRDECHKCTRRKGIAFLANVPKPPPRAPTPLAVRQVQQQPRSYLQALQQGSKGNGKGKGDTSSEAAKLRAAQEKIHELQRKLKHKDGETEDKADPDAMEVTEVDGEKFECTLGQLREQLDLFRRQNNGPMVTTLQAQMEAQKAAQLRSKPHHIRLAKAKQLIDNAEKAQSIVEKRQQELEEKLVALQARKVELEQQRLKAAQTVQEAKTQRDQLLQELQAEPKDSLVAPAASPANPAEQLVKACDSLSPDFFESAGTDRASLQKLLQALVTALPAMQAKPVVAAGAQQPAPPVDAKPFAAEAGVSPAAQAQVGQQAREAPDAQQPKKETLQQNDMDKQDNAAHGNGLIDFSDLIADPVQARVAMERVRARDQAAQRASPYGK